MKTWIGCLFGILLYATTAFAQISGQPKTLLVPANPVGGCTNGYEALNYVSNTRFYCSNGWRPYAGGGSAGTVSNFSAGNLAPLFTTSVATSTTTPAPAAVSEMVEMWLDAAPNTGTLAAAFSAPGNTHPQARA